MKLSNKILLGLFILVIAAQFIATLKARSIIKQAMSETNMVNESIIGELLMSDVQEKQFDIKNFSGVRLKMEGEAIIRQGNEYSVAIKGPTDFIQSEYFEVNNDNGILNIKYPRLRNHYDDIQVVITMPELERLKVEDDVKLKVEGFEGDYLKVKLSGENSLVGINNNYEDLKLNSFGETDFSFKNSIVKNADIRCLGETDISLETTNLEIDGLGEIDVDVKMNDGKIKGNIIGESIMRYSGKIKKNNLNVIGQKRTTIKD